MSDSANTSLLSCLHAFRAQIIFATCEVVVKDYSVGRSASIRSKCRHWKTNVFLLNSDQIGEYVKLFTTILT